MALSTEVCFTVWSLVYQLLVGVLVVQGQQLEDKALLCLYLRATGEVSVLRYCIFLFSAHSHTDAYCFLMECYHSLTKGLQANCSETIAYCHTNTTQPSKFG